MEEATDEAQEYCTLSKVSRISRTRKRRLGRGALPGMLSRLWPGPHNLSAPTQRGHPQDLLEQLDVALGSPGGLAKHKLGRVASGVSAGGHSVEVQCPHHSLQAPAGWYRQGTCIPGSHATISPAQPHTNTADHQVQQPPSPPPAGACSQGTEAEGRGWDVTGTVHPTAPTHPGFLVPHATRPISHHPLFSPPQGCDSSDCLLCQYHVDCMHHTSTAPGKLCTLLRKRSLSLSGSAAAQQAAAKALDHHESAQGAGSSGARQEAGSTSPAGPSKRHRAGHDTSAQGAGEGPEEHRLGSTWWPALGSAGPGDSLLEKRPSLQGLSCTVAWGQEWRYRQEFDTRPDPAPAQLKHLVPLGCSPSQASSHDMVCALEFSHDGRLLAAGSIAKQVGVRMVILGEGVGLEVAWMVWNGSGKLHRL